MMAEIKKRDVNKKVFFPMLILFFSFFCILLPVLSPSNPVCSTTLPSPHDNLLETILNNWKSTILAAVLLSVALLALAYMVGEGFSLPQLKSWAVVEMGNAAITILLVVLIVSVVSFLDSYLAFQVNNSPSSPFHCNPNEFCTVAVADQYLTDLIDLAYSIGKQAYIQGGQAMQNQIKGSIISCGDLIFYLPCLFFSHTQRPNSYMVLDYERATIEMRIASDLANVLNIQKFFSIEVGTLIGPFLIVLGILLRAIPQLRKAGGVLLASGLGVFFVFPAMYAWNAMTLNVAIYGDELASLPSDCPQACLQPVPIGYRGNTIASYPEDIGCFSTDDPQIKAFLNGSLASLNGFTSCEYLAKHSAFGYCPPVCRQLPYPYYIGGYDENNQPFGCGDPEVERACNHLDRRCKIVRQDLHTLCDSKKCPDYCKTVLPMKADGGCDVCTGAPHSCRVALREGPGFPDDGLQWRLRVCVENYTTAVTNCPASMDPTQSCMYVVGEPPSKACVGPLCCIGPDCQFVNVQTKDGSGNIYSGVAYKCAGHWGPTETCKPGTCFVSDPWNHLYDPQTNTGVCKKDPNHKCGELSMYPKEVLDNYYPYCDTNKDGIIDNSERPLYYNISAACWNTNEWCRVKNGVCDPNTPPCLGFGRDLEEPSARCNGCTEVRQACVFDDNYLMFCDEECLAGQYGFGNPTKITPAEFTRASQKYMVGRSDMINVAALLFPAYALPLLNIVVTLMFIRTFAPLFGGDFYIPGWVKVM